VAIFNCSPASETTVTWSISGLSNPWRTQYYQAAYLSTSSAPNTTTAPSGILSTQFAPGSGSSNSTPSVTTSGGDAFSAGNTYRLYGTVRNASGSYTNVGSVTVTMPSDTTPPSTNGFFSITSITETSITIFADGATDTGSGVAGYRVYYQLGETPTPSIHFTTIYGRSGYATISGLSPGTLYTVGTKAFDNAGNYRSDFTYGEVTTVTAVPTAPTVLNRINGGFDIQWGSVPGATDYQLDFKQTANQAWQSTTTSLTWTTVNLGQWGIQYDFRVRASKNNRSTWGGYSGTNRATTNPRPPTLSGNYTNGTATLTVSVASGNFSVVVVDRYLRTNNALVDSKMTSLNGGSVTWTIASGIQQYNFRAQSRLDVNNTSLYSLGSSNTVQFDRPASFEWTYAGCSLSHPFNPISGNYKIQNLGFYVTAEEWNALIQKVLAFRTYKGLVPFSYNSAVQGDQLRAAQFNQVRNAIAAMNTVGLPGPKNPGDTITAKDFNDLVACLNAIQ
jgi:Fibronectin type III domain.